MTEYHKIDAPFKRDKTGKLIYGDWCRPEFKYLYPLDWEFTEKVDGTNIRIDIERIEDTLFITIGGRTDRAQIPPALLAAVHKTLDVHDKDGQTFTVDSYTKNRSTVLDAVGGVMVARDIGSLTIYGEGYGPKINGGGKYGTEPKFVVFDVRVFPFWLLRTDVEDFCAEVGLDSVPVLGVGSLLDAIGLVKYGWQMNRHGDILGDQRSTYLKSQWGDFEAEGVVAVPVVPLFNRAGNRIITKIKAKDFK